MSTNARSAGRFKKAMIARATLALLAAGIAVVALAQRCGASKPSSPTLPPAATTTTATSTGPPESTLAPGVVASEDVTGITQMLTRLGQAMASGQVETQFQLLHPAVVAHYDAASCRMVLTRTDTSAKFEVVSVAPAEDYAYTSNGKTTVVPDTFAVTVNHTQAGQTQQQVIHVAKNGDGSYAWFTNCGPG